MSYSMSIAGRELRRRLTDDQKETLLAEPFGPGGNITALMVAIVG